MLQSRTFTHTANCGCHEQNKHEQIQYPSISIVDSIDAYCHHDLHMVRRCSVILGFAHSLAPVS